MARWELIIPGTPIPQGRPRAYKTATGQIRMYDPDASKNWKSWVRYMVWAKRPNEPSVSPLVMSVIFWMPRPKSLPKRVTHHTKKPDCSNLVKGLEDALVGTFMRDDAQIVELHIQKRYAEHECGVTVILEEV